MTTVELLRLRYQITDSESSAMDLQVYDIRSTNGRAHLPVLVAIVSIKKKNSYTFHCMFSFYSFSNVL